ncbi:MAG TPA: RNA polymerase sigma factor [Nocardioides sp.]|uniref:RNA polymerase sigma factor n=1 Tax=Nocardioides sp. TaxID=35761 RepID=UPI002E2EB69D|nr:RNA polymerase sigma factor [Nocardioides sp.]HEX5090564.1 RNA polymerase sigma factor [Nocardioides sp.]
MRDDEVVAAAKCGDEDAWRTLYRAHAGRLVVWLRTRSGGDGAVTAEDIAAQAWLTAAEKVGDYTGGADEFGAWLFGIARRIAANVQRRGSRRQTDPVAEVTVEPIEGPESAVADGAWVRELLATLTPRERDVVACVDVVGLSVADAARALGLTPVAVRVARHRALRRLRRDARLAALAVTVG